MDKAGKKYWDDCWSNSDLPKPIDPYDRNWNNYVNRQFHEYFSKLFTSLGAGDKKLLEIGCARSAWLPYYRREFGYSITGIDYSEIGCEASRQILTSAGVEGEVICANFFTPPDNLVDFFDIVVSFGVVEHFDKTSDCLSAFSRFLHKSGIIITIVPNLSGIIGYLQKLINEEVYKIHIPLNREELRRFHQEAGFSISHCDYFLATNFGVLNGEQMDEKSCSTKLKQKFQVNLSRFSKLLNVVDEKIISLPKSQFLSPYIICTAKKLC
ncbi:class I SAM-dependent methyltransferase [Oscillatoria sp. FACHB-1406]|uniref:class I SAM-dependent methyltransferase n=1 Tax=Oscillatoria sp. FACHB-1406 TaxID=2692846 RepID=UPI0016834B1B|nr:class I SAM-dependent methyltransferase [Oscillatoria sp. FACHB-1406]MBD2577201.1 class I SAM-dependent methyltransferase [Oscillatoria sp. FACHB-1406]